MLTSRSAQIGKFVVIIAVAIGIVVLAVVMLVFAFVAPTLKKSDVAVRKMIMHVQDATPILAYLQYVPAQQHRSMLHMWLEWEKTRDSKLLHILQASTTTLLDPVYGKCWKLVVYGDDGSVVFVQGKARDDEYAGYSINISKMRIELDVSNYVSCLILEGKSVEECDALCGVRQHVCC